MKCRRMPLPRLYRNWHKNNVHTSHSQKQDDMAKYDKKKKCWNCKLQKLQVQLHDYIYVPIYNRKVFFF